MEIEIVLKGRPKSKKNSKRVVYVKGRMLMLPSLGHKEWHAEMMATLLDFKPKTPISCAYIKCVIYSENKRKFDLSNAWESVGDLLNDAGIMEDDNVYCLPNLLLQFGGVDKENPRCVITITEQEKPL